MSYLFAFSGVILVGIVWSLLRDFPYKSILSLILGAASYLFLWSFAELIKR